VPDPKNQQFQNIEHFPKIRPGPPDVEGHAALDVGKANRLKVDPKRHGKNDAEKKGSR